MHPAELGEAQTKLSSAKKKRRSVGLELATIASELWFILLAQCRTRAPFFFASAPPPPKKKSSECCPKLLCIGISEKLWKIGVAGEGKADKGWQVCQRWSGCSRCRTWRATEAFVKMVHSIQHHTTSTMRMHAEKMILFVCVARCEFLKTGSRRAPEALEAAAIHMLISKELGLVPSTWDPRCPGTEGLLFLLQNLICAIFSLLSLLILGFARPRE